MKAKSFFTILTFLLMSFIFTGCNHEDNTLIISEEHPESPGPLDPTDEDDFDPTITVYSLYGRMCQWTHRTNDGKVMIINSDEEMRKYLLCHMDHNDYYAIDFSKQSLLLAGSVASSGIYDIRIKSMQKLDNNQYELDVVINLNAIPEPLGWDIAVLTNKLREDTHIELKVTELPSTCKSISGKWQLMKGVPSGMVSTDPEFDYSTQNIVYEFFANGVLKITGNEHVGYPGIGEFTYSIENYGEIRIENILFWYSFFSNNEELLIDGRPLDGYAFYFVKKES